MKWLALALVVALAAPASAQPAVDPAELPPLPEATATPEETGHAEAVAAAAAEEDVVVGAGKREQSLGNVASAVTVITGERLRRFGYRTVAEALRGVAGAFVVDDHMSDRVGIRGLQPLGDFNTRILVLVDGATVNEPWAQFAGVGWDAPIAIDDIARIEIIRGPVSSLYGTNAFFGIINIVTRSAEQSPLAWGRMTGSSFTGGSASAGFAMGSLHRQLRGSFSGTYRGGETLSVPQIGPDLSDDKMQGLNASLDATWGGVFAQARAYRRVRDLPFYPYITTVGTRGNNNTDEEVMLEAGYTRAVRKNLTLTGRAYLNRYRFSDYLRYDTDPTDPTTIDVFRDFGDSTWYGGEARARWDILPGDRLGLTAGGEVTKIDTVSHSYDVSGTPDTRVPKGLDEEGLYAELDGQPTGWLGFSGGARFDRNSLFENRVSPRAALFLARQQRYGIKLLYAQGFRNPSPYEGYFADMISFDANPKLRAETIDSYELVLWGKPKPGLSVRLSGYDWDARKIIEQQTVSDGHLQFQNFATRTSVGVEGEASYRDVRGWLGFAGLGVDRVRDQDGNHVPGAPYVTGSLGVSTPPVFGRANLSTELDVVGPRDTRVPGVNASTFVMWNAAVYLPDVHGVDVTVGARNLIGRREQVPAQEDYDRSATMITPILPGEGRELYARIGVRY